MNNKYNNRNNPSKTSRRGTLAEILAWIKLLCPITSVLSFIYILGVVGGFDNGSMTFGALIVNVIMAMAVLGVSVWATNRL